MATLLTGARLFTGDTLIEGQALLLDDHGRIADIVPADHAPPGSQTVALPAGSLLAPGFIDLQVNGGGGILFNATPTAAAARAIAAAMRPFGTTGLLPTLITDSRAAQDQAAAAILDAAADPASGVLGLHLEGPFISADRAGIHNPADIRQPDADDRASLAALAARLTASGGRLLLTLAPERVDDDTIAAWSAAGAVIAAGHTAASYERVMAALPHGIRGFTHLTNAMPPIVNRQPGPVVAALDSRDTWCGIIADGIHVHPALLRVMLAAKPPGRLFLVTDAMPPVGTDARDFTLYGQTIFRRNGRLESADGVLAGADIDMARSVRHCCSLLGLPLEEALRMASLYPAAFLRLDHDRGRLAPGYRADLTLLNADLAVLATWVNGQPEWHHSPG